PVNVNEAQSVQSSMTFGSCALAVVPELESSRDSGLFVRRTLSFKRDAKSTLEMINELVEEEGARSLYRGLQPVLYSLFCSGFVNFYTFHGLRRIAGEKTAIKDLLIGAIAGTVNVLTTTPLWVVSQRLKMKGAKVREGDEHLLKNSEYHGLLDGLYKVRRQEGVSALWSGTLASLVLVSNPAIQFMIFEGLKRNLQDLLSRQQLSPMHIFLLGGISKLVSTLVTYPIQLVQSKKRHGSQDVKEKSMTAILTEIVEKDGVNGAYRGLESKLLQTVIATALMYVLYDRIYNAVTAAGTTLLKAA
ncbi:Peroxisomal membrane protein PMP34, partial [Fragariocoptes setiger]